MKDYSFFMIFWLISEILLYDNFVLSARLSPISQVYFTFSNSYFTCNDIPGVPQYSCLFYVKRLFKVKLSSIHE